MYYSRIERIKKVISNKWHRRSAAAYISYLREGGVIVGKGTMVRHKTCLIDMTRPSLITIGENCFLNDHFTLLTHDFVSGVFVNSGRTFINSSGRVKIGNNVRFGHNVMVLKGVTIGDNCFIGAGSIVSKDIPSNSVAVGVPCKVVCTLEDYYQKRLQKSEQEALDYARSIKERFGRRPVLNDFWEEFPWFLDGSKVSYYPDFAPIVRRQLGISYDNYIKNHHAKYDGLDYFLEAAGIE